MYDSSMGRCMDHGWMGGSWMDRSMDRSIIDGWMDPSIDPAIRPYIHSHRSERFLFHQNVRQGRSNCHRSTFLYLFNILFYFNIACKWWPATLVPAQGPFQGHAFWKPIVLNKTKAFLFFGLFESLSCSPLASGREESFLFH